MKGLEVALRDLNAVEVRLGKLYGLKRIEREDYDRLIGKVDTLREDMEKVDEQEGITFGDPNSQTPWTPERIERERAARKAAE